MTTARHARGFTLVETLVAIGTFSMFFAAVVFILQQVLTNIGESRLRTPALALGQSKMELIRNLPYANVGTVGGIPSGPIAQNETVTINNLPFTVTTSIVYIDDPFDGVAPADTVPTDYKRARVEITWGGTYPSRVPVSLITNISPKGIETSAGGGTLFIQVFDSNGQPINNASVTIDNTVVSPAIHTTQLTNSSGLVVLPGSPACVTCYMISVTKSGYSTARTYTSVEVANPSQPLSTVLTGQLTQISFAIDAISSLTVNSVGPGPGYPTVAGVAFTIRGTKIIGYDTQDKPVYKYQFSTNTGGGTVGIPNLEWDSYILDFTNSSYNLAGSNPVLPVGVSPGSSQTLQAVVSAKTSNSLLVTVTNSASQRLASAAAELSNTSGYDVTKYTPATGSADFGQAFFGSLTAGTYSLHVSLGGYQDSTSSATVSGTTSQTVSLNSAP